MLGLSDKEMKKFLRVNRTNVVDMSDSEDDFDYKVERGYFSSSSEEDADKNEQP